MINLTTENKEAIRKYYYDMFELKLKMKKVTNVLEYENARKYVDLKISLYLAGKSKKNFSDYIADDKLHIRKPKTDDISIGNLFLEAKNGNLESMEYIIKYYQIMLEYKINIKYNSISNKEEIINSGKKYIKEAIKRYIAKDDSNYLANYMHAYVIPSFFGDNNLDTLDDIDSIYDSSYNSAIKRINYNGLLSNEEVQNFIMAYLKEKIDNYIKNNGKKKNKLIIYMEIVISRLIDYCKDEEQVLIRYNKFFNNKYLDTLDYFYYKYRYLIYEIVDKNNLSELLSYEIKFKEIIKEYVDNNINKKITLSTSVLKDKLSELKKKESNFDYDLARNGSKEDKRIQKNILMEELQYMKDDFREKYVFYTDKDHVDEKMDLAYKNSIASYINGISSKNPKSYVWTRMNQALKPFSESTQESFNKSRLKNIYRKKAFNIVNAYVKYNNLSGDELNMFLNYCNDSFNNFINKGTYDDVCGYMISAITKYDANLTNEMNHIKSHLKNKCLK